jgi:hypothetical protein
MVEVLKEKFADLNLTYSIGGQISFDVFPKVSWAAYLKHWLRCVTPDGLPCSVLCCGSSSRKAAVERAEALLLVVARGRQQQTDMHVCCMQNGGSQWDFSALLRVVCPAGLGQDLLPAVCGAGL